MRPAGNPAHQSIELLVDYHYMRLLLAQDPRITTFFNPPSITVLSSSAVVFQVISAFTCGENLGFQ